MVSLLAGLGLSLMTLLQGVGGCPPSDAQSLAQDPTVAEAFDQAWLDSNEGSPSEHEEGGWIYHCQGVNTDNPAEWVTIVDRWPSGDINHATPTALSKNEDCDLAGSFHTHPGPPFGEPHNDGFHNELPSVTDVTNAFSRGVPGFIIFGDGTNPAGTTIRPYGPPEPTKPCTPNPAYGPPPGSGPGDGGTGGGDGGSGDGGSGDGGSGDSDDDPDNGVFPSDGSGGDPPGTGATRGDPHLITFDGTHVDFQASGEFVVVRSTEDEFELQARQEMPFATSHVTQNTVIAVRLDGAVVEVSDDRMVVDGEELDVLAAGESLTTPGGGTVEGGPGSWVFTWADGTRAHFLGRSVVVQLTDERQDAVEGLLGNYDGDPTNDAMDADGESLFGDGELTFEETYGQLAPAWQVTEDNSLFTYADGDSPATFARDDVPGFGLYVDLLSDQARAEAEEACRDAGVDDPQQLMDCALDVGTTGDTSFAEEAAAVEDLLTGGTSTDPDTEDEPAIVRAARLGDRDEVNRLLAAGAEVDETDGEERTALHLAVFAGRDGIVAALLAAGADPDHQDDNGETPLHIAATFDLRVIAELLVDVGTDESLENDNGQTARDIAEEHGNTEIVELLE